MLRPDFSEGHAKTDTDTDIDIRRRTPYATVRLVVVPSYVRHLRLNY